MIWNDVGLPLAVPARLGQRFPGRIPLLPPRPATRPIGLDCPHIYQRMRDFQSRLFRAQEALRREVDEFERLEASGASVETLRQAGGELNDSMNALERIRAGLSFYRNLYLDCLRAAFTLRPEAVGPAQTSYLAPRGIYPFRMSHRTVRPL